MGNKKKKVANTQRTRGHIPDMATGWLPVTLVVTTLVKSVETTGSLV